MLHTSCKVIILFVPDKKIFLMVFTLYGHGGHLGHLTWTICFIIPLRLHMKFGFNRPSVSEKKMLEIVEN